MEVEKDFLLKEYDRLHQLTLREIQSSEQRVNFFLTIVSAVEAGIFILFEKSGLNYDDKLLAALIINFLLMLFGFQMQNYVNKKDSQMILLRDLRNEILGMLADKSNKIKSLRKYIDDRTLKKDGLKGKFNEFISGGASLNSLVTFINRCIIAIWSFLFFLHLGIALVHPIVIPLLIFFVLRFFIPRYNKFGSLTNFVKY